MNLIASFMNVNYTFLNVNALNEFKSLFIGELMNRFSYEGITYDDTLASYSYAYKQVYLDTFLHVALIANVRKNYESPIFPNVRVADIGTGSTKIRKNLTDLIHLDMNRWNDDGGAVNAGFMYDVI